MREYTTKAITTPRPAASSTEPPKSSRELLREYCKKYHLEPNEFIVKCHLKFDSTEAEWASALSYGIKKYGGSIE